MPNKSVDLDHSLYQILIENQLDNFSVLELRDTFMKFTNLGQDKHKVRRFVYRHILRLERLKLLEKVTEKSLTKPKYQKTSQFSKTKWNTAIKGSELESEPIELKHQKENRFFLKLHFRSDLSNAKVIFWRVFMSLKPIKICVWIILI